MMEEELAATGKTTIIIITMIIIIIVIDHNHHYYHNYYRQYQYTSAAQPGDASPYSVSSELYKHVLPQYFQFSRPTSRGSVLV